MASEGCFLAFTNTGRKRDRVLYRVAVLGRSGDFPTVMTLVFIKKIVVSCELEISGEFVLGATLVIIVYLVPLVPKMEGGKFGNVHTIYY